MLEGRVVEDKRRDIKYHNFKGADRLKELVCSLHKGSKVLVYFDPDVDGVLAGYFVCKLLKTRGIEFSWFINSKREHGFKIPIERVSGFTVIAVDFQISEGEVISLVDGGVNIYSMDHHLNGENLIEYTSNGVKGVVVNNQYPFEEEDSRYLSGAGVVFETIISCFPEFDTLENRSVVGITLLSDIRDIENDSARGYLFDLYHHKKRGYIGYLIDNTIGDRDFGFGVPRLDRNYVDYKLSPIINSCLRFNEQDMVVEFILGSGFIDKEYHKMQKELVRDIEEKAKVIELPNLRVVYFYEKDFEFYSKYLSSFVGLLASRKLDGSKSVISYLIGDGAVLRASFRGNVNGLHYLANLGKIVEGVGHESAFGIKSLRPSKELFINASSACKEVEVSSNYKREIIETGNLSMFSDRIGKRVGIDNTYCLSHNRVLVKYTGNNIKTKRAGAKYEEFSIDGVSVMCFDSSLKPDTDLILPITERGLLNFYLDEKYKGG